MLKKLNKETIIYLSLLLFAIFAISLGVYLHYQNN